MLEQNFPKFHYKNPCLSLFKSVISSFSEIWLFLQDMSNSCNFKWSGKPAGVTYGFSREGVKTNSMRYTLILICSMRKGQGIHNGDLFSESQARNEGQENSRVSSLNVCLRKRPAKQTKTQFHFPIVPWMYFDVAKSVLCATYQHRMTEV